MRTAFFQSVHMPFLVILLCVVWMMIAVRLQLFLRRSEYARLRSLRGLSVVFTVSAGVFLTVYIFLNAGIYGVDQHLYSVFDRHMNAPGEQEKTQGPADLTAGECSQIIGMVKGMMQAAIASRIFLLLALWTVKGSLVAIYLQTLPILGRRKLELAIFQAAGPAMVLTLAVAFWLTLQSIFKVLAYPTADDIRQGAYMTGVTFWELDDATELTITLLNVFTDVWILFMAYCTITSIHGARLAQGWLLFAMGSLTIAVAVIRVIFEIVSISCSSEQCYASGVLDRLMPPIMVMGECEAFTAIIVACLPSLRAEFRLDDDEESTGCKPSLNGCTDDGFGNRI